MEDAGLPPEDSGMFVQANCSGTPDGFCPCRVADSTTNRYLFCPDIVNWERARDLCRSFGYELVRIDSAEEHQFVWTSAVTVLGAQDYWIGLTDVETEGTWLWSDASPLGEYGGWAADQPDSGGALKVPVEEDCVEILAAEDGNWNDRDCTVDYLDYICEGPL